MNITKSIAFDKQIWATLYILITCKRYNSKYDKRVDVVSDTYVLVRRLNSNIFYCYYYFFSFTALSVLTLFLVGINVKNQDVSLLECLCYHKNSVLCLYFFYLKFIGRKETQLFWSNYYLKFKNTKILWFELRQPRMV